MTSPFVLGSAADLASATDPRQLVAGDPEAIATSAAALIAIGTGMGQAGDAMAALSLEDGWEGEAAEAFRETIAPYPRQWQQGRALAEAGHALNPYGDTVRWAQSRATQAIYDYAAAVAATKEATDVYNQAVDRHNQALDAANSGQGPAPAPLAAFTDPGAAGRARAQQLLDDARRGVDTAAQQLLGVLTRVRDELPATPNWWDRFTGEIVDTGQQVVGFVAGVGEGAASAAESMARVIRVVNPFDPWNQDHPLAMGGNAENLVTSLASAVVTHPVDLVKNLVDWKDWTSGHQGRATGEIGFNVLLGMAGGASVGRAVADAATGGLASLARGAVSKGLGAIARKVGTDAADGAGATAARAGADAAGNLGHAAERPGPPPWNPTEPAGPAQPGAFGHPDLQPAPPATPAHTPPAPGIEAGPDPLQAADQRAATAVQHAGGGLDGVEQKLNQLNVHPDLGGGAPPTPHADIPPGGSMSRELPAAGGDLGARRPILDQYEPAAPRFSWAIGRRAARAPRPTEAPARPEPLYTGDEQPRPRQVDTPTQRPGVDPIPAGTPLDGHPQVLADLEQTAMEQPSLPMLDAYGEPLVWRTTNTNLYRFGNRGEAVFTDGFPPRDIENLDLRHFVADNDPSGFISTTMNPDAWRRTGSYYFYDIDAPGGLDVNATLGKHTNAWEQEIAFPGGIRPERVRGLWEIVQDPVSMRRALGQYVRNPNYSPIP